MYALYARVRIFSYLMNNEGKIQTFNKLSRRERITRFVFMALRDTII